MKTGDARRAGSANASPAHSSSGSQRSITIVLALVALAVGLLYVALSGSSAVPSARVTTNADRLDDYREYSRRSTYFAGAAVALLALTASELGVHLWQNSPTPLAAAAITLSILAGFVAGTARVQFEWEAASLERRIRANTVDPGAETTDKWPRAADWFFKLAAALTVFAALCFLTVLWIVAAA